MGSAAAIAVAVVVLGACDLLTVSDPRQSTTSDLDNALDAVAALHAVANGVESAVHEPMDNYVVYQALLSDVYQHTGKWSSYNEVDHGWFQYGIGPMDNMQRAWHRVQWFATDAERRFKRVLGDAEAAASEMTAQVRMAGGFADLYNGMAFCEGVTEANGPAATDMQLLQQAVRKFTDAMRTARAAGRPDIAMASRAGRAQANLIVGDMAAAASDAAAIPDGFSYDALFSQQSDNRVVLATTKTFNEAAGLMHKWWPMIEMSDGPGFMKDPLSGMPDMRIRVFFDGSVATDNITPHYSQWKYNALSDDIPMVHSDGMRLIEAEALMGRGDYGAATAILNELRAAVGLPGHAVPASHDMMQTVLLWERFAEHFMEGQRALDLHRFGLTRQIFDELNDAERPGAGRPTKFSMSDTEALYNANVDNDLLKRCLPVS